MAASAASADTETPSEIESFPLPSPPSKGERIPPRRTLHLVAEIEVS
jgi:hypothetical protein